jgi:hypothetical protein
MHLCRYDKYEHDVPPTNYILGPFSRGLVNLWVRVSMDKRSRSIASASDIGPTWPDMSPNILIQNDPTNWQSISACVIASVCWLYFGHTGDTEVKADSFAAVQYAFACIIHNNERILGTSASWWTYHHTVSGGVASDAAAADEDDCYW